MDIRLSVLRYRVISKVTLFDLVPITSYQSSIVTLDLTYLVPLLRQSATFVEKR